MELLILLFKRHFQPPLYWFPISFFLLFYCGITSSQVRSNEDREVTVTSLPIPNGNYMREFERIQIEQFGIKVTNLTGHRIGCSPALPRTSIYVYNPNASLRPSTWPFEIREEIVWNPVTGFRETLRGTLKKYEVETGHMDDLYTGSDGKKYRQGEYDWNLYIEPASSHRAKFNADRITGEITPGENFYDNIWFPLKGTGRPSALLNYDICVYGPYVKDKGNSDGLEIHPIDAIWWQHLNSNSKQIRVMLLQDAAKGRFREAGMYHKESCDDNFGDWKPWVQYPQLEEIRIPFTYNSADRKFTNVEVLVHDTWDITTEHQMDWRDSDDGTQHQLLLGGNLNRPANFGSTVLIRVSEVAGKANRQIAVQFTDITRDAQGVIRGYIQLLVALGDKENKHEGVMVFSLNFSKLQNSSQGEYETTH